MPHTILHEWEKRDKRARKKKGKRKDRKSIEEQMPGEIEAITAGPREERYPRDEGIPRPRRGRALELAMAGPAQGPLPWKGIPPWKEKPKPTKKGGRVRGYSSGGKIRGAGKVKKGVRKAKMVKMKG